MSHKINSKQKRLIHVARKQLGLSDENYRELLAGVRASSSSDLTVKQFQELMKQFEKLGFVSSSSEEFKNRKNAYDYHSQFPNGRREEMSHTKMLEKITKMWQKLGNEGEDWEENLNKFLSKRFHISHWRFLKKGKAIKVIQALKAMYLRKCLVAATERCYPNNNFVENRLLKTFNALMQDFTKEELAVILVCVFQEVGDFWSGYSIEIKTLLEEMDFRGLIENERNL